jgi:ketosteroid isomerase-like protein
MRRSAVSVAMRLRDAINAHDVEAMLDCFHEDYTSEQPVHPGRSFTGRAQVRANWSTIFEAVPDFAAELVTASSDEDREWSEWRWAGTRRDQSRLDAAGVILAGVRDGRIAWARLYMEPVEAEQERIEEAVRHMLSGASDGA